MVSALVPEAYGPGSSPGRGHCFVFLAKTLYLQKPGISSGPIGQSKASLTVAKINQVYNLTETTDIRKRYGWVPNVP